MKIVQAAVLVLVGALGAMLYVKVKGNPEQPAAVTQPAAQPVAATTPAPAPPVEVPAAQPAPEPVKKRPTREPARTTIATRRDPVAAPVSTPPASAPPVAASTPAPVETPVAPPREEMPVKMEAPPPPPPRSVTITAGTLIPVRLIETVSSDRNHPGDTFTASLDEPLVADGFVIAERGARVEGRILSTQEAGRVKGLSQIALALTSIMTSDGQRVEITTDSFAKNGPESKGSDAAKIGGAAAIGAAIGAIAGGGKGAAIGAGVGGAAGTGGVMATRGKPAVLPSETKISFRLSNSVTVTERRKRG